jgi:hypothetical protein
MLLAPAAADVKNLSVRLNVGGVGEVFDKL